jgi:23S rRNA pseudouridine955/2504/2580 synthase
VGKSKAQPTDRRVRAESTYVGLVRGITHKRGSLGATRYERLAIAHGHSLLRWTSAEPSVRARQSLARLGHPVIGDRRFGDPATNRHFEEKHTIDRAFLHCLKIEWPRVGAAGAGETLVVSAPLADELTAALAKFGIDAAKQLMVG